jgi:hypothetical protein
MVLRLGILVLVLGSLFGCGFNLNVTRGSGNVITESRAVSDFHAVTLAGVGDLQITRGDTESLTVEADDNLLPLITTKVENGTLTIGWDTNRGTISVNPTRPIKYNLQVKNLDSILLAGAGNINAPSLTADNFVLTSSGAGNINLTQLQAKNLQATISGAGNMTISGQVESQTASLTGLGSYTAGDLKSNTTFISVSGAGSATVWAATSLDVKISGAGSVNYYGSPQVTQSISGVGSVKNVGNK